MGVGPRVGAFVRATLRSDAVERYDELHRAVPREVLDAIATAGVDDWTVWREGTELFQIVVASSWEQIEAALANQPVSWQTAMSELVDPDAPALPVVRVEVPWMLREPRG